MIYRRNKNTGEVHRLDPDGRSLEQCQIDDLLDKNEEELEEADALRIVAGNAARACGHCWPQADAPKENAE